MSSIRRWTLKLPSRSCDSAVGSIPYSSGGRPATALSPMLGICWPSKTHTSVPSALCTRRGARSFQRAGRRPSHMSGGSTTWSSTLTRIRSSIFTGSSLLTARACGGQHTRFLTGRQNFSWRVVSNCLDAPPEASPSGRNRRLPVGYFEIRIGWNSWEATGRIRCCARSERSASRLHAASPRTRRR